MSSHLEAIGSPPAHLTCDPLARTFPACWKDTWFRRRVQRDQSGRFVYLCPICNLSYDHRMIEYLQGDHIWPYSLFGPTSWDNYQLICGDCNRTKSNKLNSDIRRALGEIAFREIVATHLATLVAAEVLDRDAVIQSLLGHAKMGKSRTD